MYNVIVLCIANLYLSLWMQYTLFQNGRPYDVFFLFSFKLPLVDSFLKLWFMIDHRSYTHNLSSCEIETWRKFRPELDSNPWPLRYRCNALSTELSIIHILQVYKELTKWPAPRWLDSSVGRALHRHHRGHEFESSSGLNFLQASILQLLKLCV